jgi:hypothetical protein
MNIRSLPNSGETEQQDCQVRVTKNDIEFPHGTAFVPYSYLAELLAEAQCYGEVDNTNMHEFYVRIKHREALFQAVNNGDLPVKDKSSKTRINLGSVSLIKNQIEQSTCVTIADFQIYANALGVTVSVAELSNGTQENEAAVSAEQRPIQRAAAQNAAILEAIKTNGYVAKSLPKSKPGKSGVKATIRNAVATNSLFQGKVFDKAWERLRSSGEIVDEI